MPTEKGFETVDEMRAWPREHQESWYMRSFVRFLLARGDESLTREGRNLHALERLWSLTKTEVYELQRRALESLLDMSRAMDESLGPMPATPPLPVMH